MLSLGPYSELPERSFHFEKAELDENQRVQHDVFGNRDFTTTSMRTYTYCKSCYSNHYNISTMSV